MIITVLFYILGVILYIIMSILTAITFVVPQEWITSPQYFLVKMLWFNGWLNVDAMLKSLGWYLVAVAGAFTYLGFKWLYGHIPWIGKTHQETKVINPHQWKK